MWITLEGIGFCWWFWNVDRFVELWIGVFKGWRYCEGINETVRKLELKS